MNTREITVDVLSVEGCQTVQPTIELIKAIARRSGINAKIRQRTIATNEEAAERKFIGSPTVQIAGRDIDPEMRLVKNYGLG
jgi:hypothetical protein